MLLRLMSVLALLALLPLAACSGNPTDDDDDTGDDDDTTDDDDSASDDDDSASDDDDSASDDDDSASDDDDDDDSASDDDDDSASDDDDSASDDDDDSASDDDDDSASDDDDSTTSSVWTQCATPGNDPFADGWTGFIAVPGGVFGDGDSTLNGGGSAGITDPSWGMWSFGAPMGQPGAANAGMVFPGGALSDGDSVSIEFDNGWVDVGGEVGVSLYALGIELMRFAFQGGDTHYEVTDAAGPSMLPLLPFSVDGMTVEVFQRSLGTYDLEVDGVWMRSGVLDSGGQGPLGVVDELRVFSHQAGQGPSDHDVYFNCIEVFR
jgi:hypothetical protein